MSTIIFPSALPRPQPFFRGYWTQSCKESHGAYYSDDILISSADKESHLRILEEVFSRLEKHGFKLRLEKCEFLMTHVEYLGHVVSKHTSCCVTAREIQQATQRDVTLGKVYRYVQDVWPSQVTEEVKPYRRQLTELTIEGGCVMWGIRVVIPKCLQSQVLKSLQANPPGISQMKAIIRSHF